MQVNISDLLDNMEAPDVGLAQQQGVSAAATATINKVGSAGSAYHFHFFTATSEASR